MCKTTSRCVINCDTDNEPSADIFISNDSNGKYIFVERGDYSHNGDNNFNKDSADKKSNKLIKQVITILFCR